MSRLGFANAALAYTGIVGVAPIYGTISLANKVLTFPLPQWIGQTVDEFLYFSYQEFMRVYFELYSGINIKFYGDRPKDENCVYISNHQSNMDWFLPVILGTDLSASGRIRYILKDTLRLLPFYGWYFELHGCVYVSKGMRQNLDETMCKHLFDVTRRVNSLWMVLFPEGTRYHPAAPNAASATTFREQMPIEHAQVAFPKTKGFVKCIKGLGSYVDAVYDVTIAYAKVDKHGKSTTTKPRSVGDNGCRDHYSRPELCSMEAMMAGRFTEIHVHVNRVPVATLPHDDDAKARWLVDAFRRKDVMLNNLYFNNTEFEGARWEIHDSSWRSLTCATVWTSLLALSLGTGPGRRLYAAQWLVCGVGGCVVSAAVLLYNRKRIIPV